MTEKPLFVDIGHQLEKYHSELTHAVQNALKDKKLDTKEAQRVEEVMSLVAPHDKTSSISTDTVRALFDSSLLYPLNQVSYRGDLLGFAMVDEKDFAKLEEQGAKLDIKAYSSYIVVLDGNKETKDPYVVYYVELQDKTKSNFDLWQIRKYKRLEATKSS